MMKDFITNEYWYTSGEPIEYSFYDYFSNFYGIEGLEYEDTGYLKNIFLYEIKEELNDIIKEENIIKQLSYHEGETEIIESIRYLQEIPYKKILVDKLEEYYKDNGLKMIPPLGLEHINGAIKKNSFDFFYKDGKGMHFNGHETYCDSELNVDCISQKWVEIIKWYEPDKSFDEQRNIVYSQILEKLYK